MTDKQEFPNAEALNPGGSGTTAGRSDPVKIGISGSYGGLNLGDEAILSVIIMQLRQCLKNVEITVFTRNPEDTRQRHNVERVVAVRNLSRSEIGPEVKRLDLFILGGGGILYDAEAQVYVREAFTAQEAGIPVVVYAVSAGPLRKPNIQAAVRDCLNKAAAITVRERNALRILEDIGIEKEIVVTADPALLLKPEPLDPAILKEEGLEGKQNLVGISVREPGPALPDIDPQVYHISLANAADYMLERFDAHAVFVPMEPNVRDIQQSHAVMAMMTRPQRATVVRGSYSPGQLLSLVSYFSFGVGMRLHFLIFLAIMGIPFAALPYASKVEGFLESLSIEMPPPGMNPGRLIAYIDRFWDNRRNVYAHMIEVIPHLQQKARETNSIVLAVLREALKEKSRQNALTGWNV